jgi:hypothetical protein
MNSVIKHNIRIRRRAYRRAKKTNLQDHWSKFRKIRNDTVSLIRKTKIDYYSKLEDSLSTANNTSKDWWKCLKTFITPVQSRSIPPILNPFTNTPSSSDYEKSEILNDYFIEQTTLNDIGKNIPILEPEIPSKLEQIRFTPSEVEDVLKVLKLGKATGPDGINNEILRELSSELSKPLCELFNASLASAKVPSSWKEAHVCAVFKKADPSIVSNYRPISLLNTIEKAFERLIFKHVHNFLFLNDFFTPFQSGFIPGDNTVNQLTFLYDTFCNAIDNGLEVRVIFFDISKAFDKVWHKGLLAKLKSAGISGELLNWFEDYLKDRKQRVVLPGATSTWKTIGAGVPQGSILGPLLFLIYINDLVKNIQSNIRLFADDTSLYIIVDNPVLSSITLQADIDTISSWAKTWLVTFNPTKSESMVISRKRLKPLHPPLVMNNEQIISISSHKHLGVYLSEDCKWHTHIDYIKTKAWSRVNVMRKLKFKLSRKTLEIIYTTFIRPILEYADVIWDNCTKGEKEELNKIQNEAARIATGTTKLVSIHNLQKEIGWETLQERRNKHKLVLLFKMKNNATPEYLSSILPPEIGQTVTYNLRNSNNIQIPEARTALYYNSFLPSALIQWNSLPLEARNLTSIDTFKNFLKKDMPKKNQYFHYGKREAQVILSRLRTKCSNLNHDLFSKSIVDSPLCSCGKVENTYHFFFDCPNYDNQRLELFNSLPPNCDLTLHTLLNGDDTIEQTANKSIHDSVHKYINQTKRFT